MNVPFFGLDREFETHRSEFLSIVEKTWATGRVLQGPAVDAFEDTLCRLCQRKHAVATGSCTDALAFALIAIGIRPGDEVLVTPFSFFASVSPILRVGAIPRFVDIAPDYFMMDVSGLDEAVSERTRAVVAVHLFGQTLDMTRINDFVRRHGLLLIEDAAQALGSRDGDRVAGSLGNASCLSFDPTKVIGSSSSAGAFLTDDEELYRRVRMLRYHGRNPETREHEMVGYNSQLPTDMAALLDYKVTKLREWEMQRAAIAEIYREELCSVTEIRVPEIRGDSTHNWHKFVIRAHAREQLSSFLKERGVTTMVHYRRPICDEPCLRAMDLPPSHVPLAREAADQVLSLPIFPQLRGDEARIICDSIKTFYANKHANLVTAS